MPWRPSGLLAIATACAGAGAGLWLSASELSDGRRIDARSGDAIHGLATESLDGVLRGMSSLADPLPFAVAAIALVALAWLRAGPRLAAIAALVVLAGNVVTQLAQPALTHARHVDFSGTDLHEMGSWPSGHATAAMLLALVAILVAGPRLRGAAALVGIAYALAVGGALVVLGRHLPGDVLAGYAMAAAFTALGAAVLIALERRRPAAVRAARAPALGPALGALAAFAVFATAVGKAVLTRSDRVADTLAGQPLLLSAAFACALAVALIAGWTLARVQRS